MKLSIEHQKTMIAGIEGAQKTFEQAARDALSEMGLEGDALDDTVQMASVSFLRQEIDKHFSFNIPSYSSQKKLRDDWSPMKHYDHYWKSWADKGYLYQDQLRKYDAALLNAMNCWCRRNKEDANQHLPPPKNKRTDLYAKGIGVAHSGEVVAAKNSLSSRESKRSSRQSLVPGNE